MSISLASDIEDPLERLKDMGKHYAAFALDYPEYYEIMFISRAPTRVDHESWPSGRNSFQILHSTVAECIESGQIDYPSVDIASLAIWSQLHGIVALWIGCRMSMMPEEIRLQMIHGVVDFMTKIVLK